MILSSNDLAHDLSLQLNCPSPSAAIRDGMLQLLDAIELSRDAEQNCWEFALEIESFVQLGLYSSHLRWMICKHLIQHAYETTDRSMDSRSFEPQTTLAFNSTSCFVLTTLGEHWARQLRGENVGDVKTLELGLDKPREDDKPIWDSDMRELRFRGEVVKRYKVPSPNQQIVLAAFDEESWPCRVDDPLMPHPEIDPKRRLHDTIKSLNRHQIVPLLRFYGDGTGEGVRWGTITSHLI